MSLQRNYLLSELLTNSYSLPKHRIYSNEYLELGKNLMSLRDLQAWQVNYGEIVFWNVNGVLYPAIVQTQTKNPALNDPTAPVSDEEITQSLDPLLIPDNKPLLLSQILNDPNSLLAVGQNTLVNRRHLISWLAMHADVVFYPVGHLVLPIKVAVLARLGIDYQSLLDGTEKLTVEQAISLTTQMYSNAYPFALLDRDDTITFNGQGYLRLWFQMTPIPYAISTLYLLQRANYRICIVTNQSGIIREKFTRETFIKGMRQMEQALSIEDAHLDYVNYGTGTHPTLDFWRKPNTASYYQLEILTAIDLSLIHI